MNFPCFLVVSSTYPHGSARERFGKGNSDLLTDVNAYDECVRRRNEGASQSSMRSFCEEVSVTDCVWGNDEVIVSDRILYPQMPSEMLPGSVMIYFLHSCPSISFLRQSFTLCECQAGVVRLFCIISCP